MKKVCYENNVLESKADTLKDMANYCLMLAVWLEGNDEI